MSDIQPVGLPWLVSLGYLRIMTSRRILASPLPPSEALTHIRSWLDQPQVQVIEPGPRHLDLLESLATAARVTGELTTDLHLAALAIEHRAELHSNDSDFSRFSPSAGPTRSCDRMSVVPPRRRSAPGRVVDRCWMVLFYD